MPDFTKFDGTTDPITHLRLYAGSLCGYKNPDKLMMQLFQHSLKGQAAQWFARLDIRRFQSWAELSQEFLKQYRHNTQLIVDRFTLGRTKKEDGESFREYALRWKDLASQVTPPLQDAEYSQTFVQTLKGIYFERLCTSVGQTFAELIRQGEILEDGVKQGRIADPYAQAGEGPSTLQTKKNPAAKKETESEIAAAIILPSQKPRQNQRFHQPAHQTKPPAPYQASPPVPYPIFPYQTTPRQNTPYLSTHPQNSSPFYSQNQQREFTPIGIPMTEVMNRLLSTGHIRLLPARNPANPPPTFRADLQCAYHSGQLGHDTEHCLSLRNKVQKLIDNQEIHLGETGAPNVITNPLPDHQVNAVFGEGASLGCPSQLLIGLPGTMVSYLRKSGHTGKCRPACKPRREA